MPLVDPYLPPFPAAVRAGVTIAVFRIATTISGGTTTYTFEAMPLLQCLEYEEVEGPIPAAATFRYDLASGDGVTWPAVAEQALSTAVTLPKTVQEGDRLGVQATKGDGTTEWVFDGYAYDFGVEWASGTEEVTIACVSVAMRCWDAPIPGQFMRHVDLSTTPGSEVQTDEIIQFNPEGVGNATLNTFQSGTDPKKYDVFLDPLVQTTPLIQRKWDLAMVVNYLLNAIAPQPGSGIVVFPDKPTVDDLLVSRQPIDDTTPFNPNDNTTYTQAPFVVPDTPLTGKFIPPAIHDFIKDLGFGLCFRVGNDGSGNPQTTFSLFNRQSATPKSLWLPLRGTLFDPTTCNMGAANLQRSLREAANQWRVFGAKKRYEMTFILAPGFPSQAGDATSGSLVNYDKSSTTFDASYVDTYRLWVFDETGEGHYANLSTARLSGAANIVSLAPILGTAQYARHRRPPIGELFKLDANGKPMRAKLEISTNYAGAYPAISLGTGEVWQPVSGGFELLKDRLGIRITTTSPQKWNIGKSEVAGHPFPTGVVRVVESIAAPSTETPAFWLRLTCVIEGDQCVEYVANRTAGSPVAWPVERHVDARDRINYRIQSAHGLYNSTAADVTVEDDSADARAEAIALRQAEEAGVFGGEVEISHYTRYYDIGDRIDQINGRNLGLRTDSYGTGYAPVLPVVVGRRFQLVGGQRTFLTLSDEGVQRSRRRLKPPKLRPSLAGAQPLYSKAGGLIPAVARPGDAEKRYLRDRARNEAEDARRDAERRMS